MKKITHRKCKWGKGKKVRYTYEEAELVLAKISTYKMEKRQECRMYRCRHCGGWHLTSKEKVRIPEEGR